MAQEGGVADETARNCEDLELHRPSQLAWTRRRATLSYFHLSEDDTLITVCLGCSTNSRLPTGTAISIS